ncbi:MAG: hypothetical protein LBC87_09110, partial [Fibromonadaceae bacterium]|nr:hypothetical protein [Fibromonadaceae bacterium]
VIKDSDGNDVRVFVKEDKKRGLRRDSSFYWNGSWEVFEMNVSHERINLDEKLNEMRKSVKDSLEKYCWKRYRSN